MRITNVILFILFLFCVRTASAQCPDKDFLWKRMQLLQYSDSFFLSPQDELKELLTYDSKMQLCKEKYDSVYSYLQMRIGIKYFLLTDYLQAVQYISKGVKTIKDNALSPRISQRYLVKFYYYLSICYDSLKLNMQKNDAIDSCIAYEMKNDTMYHFSCFLLHNSVAELYAKGDYKLCIDHSALGEKLTRKSYHYQDRLSYLLFFIGYKTNALLSLKRYPEAEKFLEEKKSEFLKSGNKADLAETYRLFGLLNKAKGNHQAAINYLLKAYEYDRHTKEKAITGEVLTQVGFIYSEKINHAGKAMLYYKKALTEGRRSDGLYINTYIANAYVKQGNFDAAYRSFQKAFDIIKPGINETDIGSLLDQISINSVETVMNTVLDKGDAYLHQYHADENTLNLQKALRVYKIADNLLNAIKEKLFAFESRLYWRSYAKRLYEYAIECSYLAKNPEQAFYFFEKSKAVLLTDQLNEQNYLSQEDLLELAHLKSKILITGRELNNTDSLSQRFAIENNLFSYKQKLLRFQENIKRRNPVYYQSIFDTTINKVADIQKRFLRKDAMYVSFFSGDKSIYALLVSANDIQFIKNDRLVFDSIKNQFVSFINNSELLNKQFFTFSLVAERLFKMIFKKPLPALKKLIISPDGQYFPFEALVTNRSEKNCRYFIQDYAVSYTYSARFFMNDYSPAAVGNPQTFIGFAPVSYSAQTALTTLPGSDKSLRKIAGHFYKGIAITSAEATKANFMQQFSRYTIAQLYTHSADSSSNNEPAIYFADSTLYLSDLIGENKPRTKLIVLSACETGLGTDYKGEGVFSFNRGFAALGIPSSVTNLWTIDNESTYKITELFYKYVADELPLDEALQQAKIYFIKTSSKEKQLPYYWAASVLVGRTDAIPTQKNRNWLLYGFSAGVPVLILFVIIAMRKKEKSIPIRGTTEIAA